MFLLTRCKEHLYKLGEPLQHILWFLMIANSSAQLLPESPKGFQIGSSAEAGQPAARAKPCVSNTDLQNISPTQRTDRQ